MYIIIDKGNMRFLKKHENVHVLINLMLIEYPERSVSIQPCDTASFLQDCTDYELKILYRNCTGKEQSFYGDSLRAVLMDIASQIPPLICNAFEVKMQADKLPEDNEIPHIYARGSYSAQSLKNHKECLLPPILCKDELSISKLGKTACDFLYPNSNKLVQPLVENKFAGYNASSPNIGTAPFINTEEYIMSTTNAKTPEQLAAEVEAKAAAKLAKANEAAAKKAAKANESAQAKAELKAKKDAEVAQKAQAKADAIAAKAAKKQPEQNGVTRPKADGLCGKAWSIFDALSAKLGAPAQIGECLKTGLAQGLNDSTIKTQFARWRKYHGITGRAEVAAVAAPVVNGTVTV